MLRALLADPDTDVDIAAGVTVLKHAPQPVAPIDPADLPQLRLHRTLPFARCAGTPACYDSH